MKQRAIPCVFMRGGTSRGPYFHARDLPTERDQLERVLLRVMGSPDARQIDGLGGGTTITSKVAIVAPSAHPDADVDYLFAQVDTERQLVDWGPTCGNIMAGIGPFAIEQALVSAASDTTNLVIRSTNTGSFIDAAISTPGGTVDYDGDCEISGVPGRASPIELRFRQISGSQTNRLLPTGRARDRIDGIEVSCVDVAVPIVVASATSLGLTGYEHPDELNDDVELLSRIERIRCEAGNRMGLGDVARSVLPKFAIVAAPHHGGHVASRYLTPWTCHQAYAVTGSIAVASCVVLPGSVAEDVVDHDDRLPTSIQIEHPSGTIAIALDVELSDQGLAVHSGGAVRTARKIMDGHVYVPATMAAWTTETAGR